MSLHRPAPPPCSTALLHRLAPPSCSTLSLFPPATCNAPRPFRQWCFIDKSGRDLFKHKGDTIVPGAGTRWKFVHRGPGKSKESDSETDDSEDEDDGEVATGESESAADRAEKHRQARGELVEVKKEYDYDLPWQVIALLDESILRDLRWSHKYRVKRVALALKGLDVEQPEESTIEGFLQAEIAVMRTIEGGVVGISRRRSSASAEGDGENLLPQAVGWVYRVVSADGVKIYKEPFDDDDDDDDDDDAETASSEGAEVSSRSGRRSISGKSDSAEGDYLQVVELHGRWLGSRPPRRRSVPHSPLETWWVCSGEYKRAGRDQAQARPRHA